MLSLLSRTPGGSLASVEVDIDGVQIAIHGIRALRVAPIGRRIELPKFRGLNGEWQTARTLPEQVRGPIGDAVLDEFIERGLAVKRTPAAGNDLKWQPDR